MEMLTTIAALGLVKLEAFAIALLDFGTLAKPSRGNRRSSLVKTEVKTIDKLYTLHMLHHARTNDR